MPIVTRKGEAMRKVRDYDAELKVLGDKARALKAKRIEQLGQLVAATGADTLDAEILAFRTKRNHYTHTSPSPRIRWIE